MQARVSQRRGRVVTVSMSRCFCLGLALAVGGVGGPVYAQRTTTLRFHYAVGNSTRYTTRTTQVLPGSLGTTVTTATHDVETLRVHPDGSADQRMRIVSMEMSGPNIPAALRDRSTTALRNVAVEYTVDARGRVTTRRAVGTVPDDLRPVFDGVLESLDQLGAVLPEGPVAPGAVWHERRSLHLAPGIAGFDVNVDTAYTLRELRGEGAAQVAVVGVSMTLTTPAGAAVRGVRMAGTGSATGESILELGRGRLGSARSNGTMRVQVSAEGRTLDLDTRFEHQMTPRASSPLARPASPMRPGSPMRPR